MKPIVYFAAGIYRSGSTWLYNAMRLMLEAKYPGQVYCSAPGRYDRQDPRPVHLTKVHMPSEVEEVVPDFVACSHRDLIDIARSLGRIGKFGMSDPYPIIEHMQEIIRMHRHWAGQAKFQFAYHDMMSEPLAVLAGLHEAMGLKLSNNVLMTIHRQLGDMAERVSKTLVIPRGDKREDDYVFVCEPVSLYHSGHISSPNAPPPPMPQATERLVRTILAKWLREHGYSTRI